MTYFTEIAKDVERLTGGTLMPVRRVDIPVKNDRVDQSLGEAIVPARYQQPARSGTEFSLVDDDDEDDDERRTIKLCVEI